MKIKYVIPFAILSLLILSLFKWNPHNEQADLSKLLKRSSLSTSNAQWMDKQICSDLASTQKITQQMLDATEKSLLDRNFKIMRCRIVHGKIHFSHSIQDNDVRIYRVRGFERILKKLSKLVSLPNVDFLVSFEDGFEDEVLEENSAPVLAISKRRNHTKVILYPEIHNYPDVDRTYQEVLSASTNVPWEQKTNRIFWRGSTTGGYYTPDNWMSPLRSRFVIFSKNYPEEFDCAFSTFCQGTPEANQLMQNANLFAKPLYHTSQLSYKYLVALDGNSFPSSQKWQLFSGSVLLKNESDALEWFDGALIPYKHYIPFKWDLSDLLEKIYWLKNHDQLAQGIANEAKKFASESLMSSQMELYVYKLLTTYEKLQNF